MELTKHWAAQLDDYVIDLAWSPDGSLLAAASGSTLSALSRQRCRSVTRGVKRTACCEKGTCVE